MSKQIKICVLMGLVMLVWGGSALASVSLDEDCVPGDSVVLLVPGDSQPWPYISISFCLDFCEGATYILRAPMCGNETIAMPPLLMWTPGCAAEYSECERPDCAPTADVVGIPDFIWNPTIPAWETVILFLPGGQEGCACVTTFFGLGLIWSGECWWLSVELMSFTAMPYGEDIQIEFTTASETDNDYFEIWRGQSPEGEFIKIAELPSQGNGPSGHHYSYVDADVTIGTTYWYYLADVDLQGNRTEHRDRMTSARVETSMPLDYALFQNYPNPFNASTEISYAIPEVGHVTLRVFNAAGQEVTTLVNEEQPAGNYRLGFDAAKLPSGIYIFALEVNAMRAAHKMVLVR